MAKSIIVNNNLQRRLGVLVGVVALMALASTAQGDELSSYHAESPTTSVVEQSPQSSTSQATQSFYQGGSDYLPYGAQAYVGLIGAMRGRSKYQNNVSGGGVFSVEDTSRDGRFIWGRIALCTEWDSYGNCYKWVRYANFYAPRAGETASVQLGLPENRTFRLQTCISAPHDRHNLDYCSKLYYGHG